jgi:hypothetical protein
VPLSLQADLLHDAFDAPVPAGLRERLRALAREAPDAGVRAAALGAVAASPRRLLRAIAAGGPAAAAVLVHDALAPPAELAALRLGARRPVTPTVA